MSGIARPPELTCLKDQKGPAQMTSNNRHSRLVRVLSVALSLFAASIPQSGTAQVEKSVTSVVSGLFDWLEVDDSYSLVPDYGQWGIVVGWFSEGERKEIRFEAEAGASYKFAGQGDSDVDDIDICVYDQNNVEIECDQMSDAIPLVTFTARSSGSYRVVLTAYSLDSVAAYAGMILLRRL